MRWKRFVSVLLVAILLLTIAPMGMASAGVYFTMINSNAPEALQSATMPVNQGGTIFVPLSVLNRLGVSSVRHPQEVRLFASHNHEIYVQVDLEAGTAITSEGVSISAQPIHRYGTLFFPVGSAGGANALASFFGFNFRLIHSDPAPTVRLYNQGVGVLTHNAVQQNGDVLFGLTGQYNSFTGADLPVPTPPPGGETAPPPAEEEAPQQPVSLSFTGLTEETAGLLDALSTAGIPAGFFVTAEDVLTHPDLVRRLHGEGHQVGIFLGEDPEADYAAASAALFEAARLRTVVVTAEWEETRREAAELGLIVHETPVRHWIPTYGGSLAGDLLLHGGSVPSQTLQLLPGLVRGGAYRVVRFAHVIF